MKSRGFPFYLQKVLIGFTYVTWYPFHRNKEKLLYITRISSAINFDLYGAYKDYIIRRQDFESFLRDFKSTPSIPKIRSHESLLELLQKKTPKLSDIYIHAELLNEQIEIQKEAIAEMKLVFEKLNKKQNNEKQFKETDASASTSDPVVQETSEINNDDEIKTLGTVPSNSNPFEDLTEEERKVLLTLTETKKLNSPNKSLGSQRRDRSSVEIEYLGLLVIENNRFYYIGPITDFPLFVRLICLPTFLNKKFTTANGGAMVRKAYDVFWNKTLSSPKEKMDIDIYTFPKFFTNDKLEIFVEKNRPWFSDEKFRLIKEQMKNQLHK